MLRLVEEGRGHKPQPYSPSPSQPSGLLTPPLMEGSRMLRLVEEGGAIYSPSPVNSGKVRKQGKKYCPYCLYCL